MPPRTSAFNTLKIDAPKSKLKQPIKVVEAQWGQPIDTLKSHCRTSLNSTQELLRGHGAFLLDYW
jgi:hypothetical protein